MQNDTQYVELDWQFDKESFAQDVKHAREARGWTQAEAGQMIGLQTLGSAESPSNLKRANPLMDTFLKICNLLDLNPAHYFVLVERAPVMVLTPEPPAPARDHELIVRRAKKNNPYAAVANVPQVTEHHSATWAIGYKGSSVLALALNILHEAAVRLDCAEPLHKLQDGDVAQVAFDHHQEFARRELAALDLNNEEHRWAWGYVERWLLDRMAEGAPKRPLRMNPFRRSET